MLVTPYAKKNGICFIAAIIAALLFILPMYFFTKWNLSNIMLLPAALYLGYIGLRLVARLGMFDIFSYQIVNWVYSWRKGMPKKYEDAYEYKSHMKEKREENKLVWIPWVSLGSICLILSIIFSFYPGLGR